MLVPSDERRPVPPEPDLRPAALPRPGTGDAAVAAAPEGTRATQAELLPGQRVLVVDDIATNRLVATTYLQPLGASHARPHSGAGGAGAALDGAPRIWCFWT